MPSPAVSTLNPVEHQSLDAQTMDLIARASSSAAILCHAKNSRLEFKFLSAKSVFRLDRERKESAPSRSKNYKRTILDCFVSFALF